MLETSIASTAAMPGSQRKPRIPFSQRVWVRAGSADNPLEAYAGNLSESGIFVQTTDAPTVGTRIAIQFSVDNGASLIETVAEVVWVKPFEPINIDGLLPGMGAKFLSIDDTNLNSLRSYIGTKLGKLPAPVNAAAEVGSQVMVESLLLEKPLALQVKGDHELVLGYSVVVNAEGVKFRPDQIPNESMLQRLKTAKSVEQKLRGCIAVPVEIASSSVAYVHKGDGQPPQLEMQLNFLELRGDLLHSVAELTNKTLNRIPTEETLFPKPTPAKSRQPIVYKTRWALVMGVALFTGLVGAALGYWLALR